MKAPVKVIMTTRKLKSMLPSLKTPVNKAFQSKLESSGPRAETQSPDMTIVKSEM